MHEQLDCKTTVGDGCNRAIGGVADEEFEAAIRGWLTAFHGGVKLLSETELACRVTSYLRQEELYREKVRFILSLLTAPPEYGLDIGSSAGGLSVAFAQAGVKMWGIEPSKPGVKASVMRARRLQLENVVFVEAVGEALPFADGLFDLVVSLAVLEHVKDVAKVLKEAFRVLKPGGWIYAEVPNNLFPFEGHYKMVWLPMMPRRLAKLYVRSRGCNPEFLDHLHYMSRVGFFRRVSAAGFTELKDVYGNFLAGKVSGAAWADPPIRFTGLRWAAPFIRVVSGWLPTAWFLNRAVYLLARKPEVCK